MKHRGPAIVFKNYNDMEKRVDDPELAVTAESVLELQGAGPIGAPGMPEWGQLPIPRNCWRKAYVTWCGFQMPACQAPPTAPVCCIFARKAGWAARSPLYVMATLSS